MLCEADKRKVLIELASAIGQLCNDEDTRQRMGSTDSNTIQCLQKTFELSGSPGENLKLKSKLLFALKQLCISNRKDAEGVGKTRRINVGRKVIRPAMTELAKLTYDSSNTNMKTMINALHIEFVFSAVMLLRTLAVDIQNCVLMKDDSVVSRGSVLSAPQWDSMEASHNITTLMDQMVRSSFWKVPDIRDRVMQLEKRVADAKTELAALEDQ